jgi:uncharacterized protein YciI
MYILISTYTRPIDEVNAQLDHHRAWLARHYETGRVLVSGRRNPTTGGVIVLRADSREQVDELLADDPYTQHGLVDYEIVAFDETPFPHRSAGFDAFAAQPISDAAAPAA